MSNSEIVPVALPNGEVIHASVTMLGGAEEEVAFGGTLPFDRVIRSIEGIAGAVRSAIAHTAPDKTSVEFGLELALDGGTLAALLVNGSAKASLKVTLEWSGTDAKEKSQPAVK